MAQVRLRALVAGVIVGALIGVGVAVTAENVPASPADVPRPGPRALEDPGSVRPTGLTVEYVPVKGASAPGSGRVAKAIVTVENTTGEPLVVDRLSARAVRASQDLLPCVGYSDALREVQFSLDLPPMGHGRGTTGTVTTNIVVPAHGHAEVAATIGSESMAGPRPGVPAFLIDLFLHQRGAGERRVPAGRIIVTNVAPTGERVLEYSESAGMSGRSCVGQNMSVLAELLRSDPDAIPAELQAAVDAQPRVMPLGSGQPRSSGADSGGWLSRVSTLTCYDEQTPVELQWIERADITGDEVPEVFLAYACQASTSSWPQQLEVLSEDGAFLATLYSTDDPDSALGLRLQSLHAEPGGVTLLAHGWSADAPSCCPDLQVEQTFDYVDGSLIPHARRIEAARG